VAHQVRVAVATDPSGEFSLKYSPELVVAAEHLAEERISPNIKCKEFQKGQRVDI
jgi:hypothetical protein